MYHQASKEIKSKKRKKRPVTESEHQLGRSCLGSAPMTVFAVCQHDGPQKLLDRQCRSHLHTRWWGERKVNKDSQGRGTTNDYDGDRVGGGNCSMLLCSGRFVWMKSELVSGNIGQLAAMMWVRCVSGKENCLQCAVGRLLCLISQLIALLMLTLLSAAVRGRRRQQQLKCCLLLNWAIEFAINANEKICWLFN